MERVKYLVLALFIGVLFLCPNLIFARGASREAKIILVKGDVKIQRAGELKWLDAKEGMRLRNGDTAKTGQASFLEIAFDRENKNVIRLYENSTAILRGKWLRQIELPEGRVRSLIKKLRSDSSFEIRTPTAVAGARGSGWDVLAGADRVEVMAFEDEIFVQAFDEEGNLIAEIIVREGWETFIERFKGPSELFELSDVERRDWDSWKEDFTKRMGAKKREEGIREGAKFRGVESIGKTIQDRMDYKDQTFETKEIGRIEDRAASESKTSGTTCDNGDDYNP